VICSKRHNSYGVGSKDGARAALGRSNAAEPMVSNNLTRPGSFQSAAPGDVRAPASFWKHAWQHKPLRSFLNF